MKALNLHAVNDLRYEEIPVPIRKKGEVLIEIKACGICGSDIQRVFEKGTYHFPTVIGHEFSGVIAEADDENLLGKKAAVFPLLPCFKCEACEKEEYAQCSDYNYFGSRCNGGMAEYISVPVFNLITADSGISYEELAMIEPCAVSRHCIKQSELKSGETVAIFGAGPIGLMLAKWAEVYGAGKIILTDIDEKKVEFAKKSGYTAINSLKEDAVSGIRELTKGRGADIAIEGAGASVALSQALRAACNFGRAICMGNPAGEMVLAQKAYWEILRKQLTLKGTWNSSYAQKNNDWKESLLMMEKGSIDLKPLISHRFDLADYQKAFGIMRDKKEFSNKIMFISNKGD